MMLSVHVIYIFKLLHLCRIRYNVHNQDTSGDLKNLLVRMRYSISTCVKKGGY